MKAPISIGYETSPLKLSLEERVDQADQNKMRFFVRSPLAAPNRDLIPVYFPSHLAISPLPNSAAISPWPWKLDTDPFVEASIRVDAMRASYLAPCIHLNMYLDWMLFDIECEQGLHNPSDEADRPSNISRRVHIDVAVHSILISLKSALDRLVSIADCYFPGVTREMTWGRIKNGKPRNFMEIVECRRAEDQLLAYLSAEYKAWIAKVVAPRDEIIHYADLHTTWTARFGESGAELAPLHASRQRDETPAFNPATLSEAVKAYYALADRTLLTLATRTPRKVLDLTRPPQAPLGDAIMKAFDLSPSPRVGELRRVVQDAIKSGQLAADQSTDSYIAFLRDHLAGQELVATDADDQT